MKSQLEFFTFGFLAVTIHLAGFISTPEEGSHSSGDAGQHLISLQQVTPQIERLLQEWTAPPEVQTLTSQMRVAEGVDHVAPTVDLNVATPNQVQLHIMPKRPEVVKPKSTTFEVPDVAIATVEVAPQSDVEPAMSRPKRRPMTLTEVDPKQVSKRVTAKKEARQQAKKTTKASKSEGAQKRQKAAGSGGGASAGASKKSKTATNKSGSSANALAVWGAQIRKKVERNKRNIRGLKRRATVLVTITVASNGVVQSVRLSKSSGNKKADAAALRAVKAAGRMPKAVNGVKGHKKNFTIPLIFKP